MKGSTRVGQLQPAPLLARGQHVAHQGRVVEHGRQPALAAQPEVCSRTTALDDGHGRIHATLGRHPLAAVRAPERLGLGTDLGLDRRPSASRLHRIGVWVEAVQPQDRVERPQRREQALKAAAGLPSGFDRAGLEAQAVARDHEPAPHLHREHVGDDAARLVWRPE